MEFTYKKATRKSALIYWAVYFDSQMIGHVYKNPGWRALTLEGDSLMYERATRKEAAEDLLDYATS
jgi:hypothetical protein